MIGPRARRLVLVALVAVLCAVLAIETIQLYFIIDGQSAIGTDLDYYRFVAERFVTTGVYYTDEQLAGPYVVQTQVHNLYPPHALYLFVPFLYLPDILWWVVPLAFLAYVIWWCRPIPWAWPVLLFLLALPKGPAQVLFGNTDMWIAAFVAGAVRWAWPGVLVSIKPSLSLFGFPGVLSRAWWLGAAALVLVSLPLWTYWLPVPRDHPEFERATVVLVRKFPVLRRADRRVDGLVASRRHARQPVVPGAARAREARSELTVGQVAPDVDRRLSVAIRETPVFRLGQPMG